MDASEFNDHLEELGLTQADVAAFLDVNARSVRRWQSGEQKVPGAVAEVVRAWRQLHRSQISWGADLESIWRGDADQIRRHHDHDKMLAALLERVLARGGPAAPWRIDLQDHSATLGPLTVRFYKLASGSFSLANYRRSDAPPDPYRDQTLIEDAVAAFARAIADARTKRPKRDWDE